MPEIVAYHEAGHALMALLLGGKVKQITIELDDEDDPKLLVFQGNWQAAPSVP